MFLPDAVSPAVPGPLLIIISVARVAALLCDLKRATEQRVNTTSN